MSKGQNLDPRPANDLYQGSMFDLVGVKVKDHQNPGFPEIF